MSKMGDGLYIDWKHRIFSLASGVLSYFKEEGSKVPFWPMVTVGGAVAHMVVCFQELGTISLVQAEIAYPEENSYEGRHILIKPHDSSRVYNLRVGSEAEALVWYRKLMETVATAALGSPDSALQGISFDQNGVVPCGPHDWLDGLIGCGVTVSASSQMDSEHGPENVIAEGPEHEVISNACWQARSSENEELIFDFQTAVELSGIKMHVNADPSCPRICHIDNTDQIHLTRTWKNKWNRVGIWSEDRFTHSSTSGWSIRHTFEPRVARCTAACPCHRR